MNISSRVRSIITGHNALHCKAICDKSHLLRRAAHHRIAAPFEHLLETMHLSLRFGGFQLLGLVRERMVSA